MRGSGFSEARAQPRIECSAEATAVLHQRAEAALPNETGGLLIGYRHEDGTITVTRAFEVADPRATPSSYVQSYDAASRILEDFLRRQTPDTVEGYVGNWHTHPAHAGSSRTDLETLARHAALDGHPVVLLTLMRLEQGWSPDWYIATVPAGGRRLPIVVRRIGD